MRGRDVSIDRGRRRGERKPRHEGEIIHSFRARAVHVTITTATRTPLPWLTPRGERTPSPSRTIPRVSSPPPSAPPSSRRRVPPVCETQRGGQKDARRLRRRQRLDSRRSRGGQERGHEQHPRATHHRQDARSTPEPLAGGWDPARKGFAGDVGGVEHEDERHRVPIPQRVARHVLREHPGEKWKASPRTRTPPRRRAAESLRSMARTSARVARSLGSRDSSLGAASRRSVFGAAKVRQLGFVLVFAHPARPRAMVLVHARSF